MSEARSEDRNPAEIYDAQFVPALFAPWGEVLADAARIAAGQQVLDVGCGTGALALDAAARVGTSGAVTGLDANAQMLAVARRKATNVRWIEGRAEALPFADASFDAVASQFALMFFDDRAQGLREMARVLRAGGRLAVAVCDALERSPGYCAFAALLERLFGAAIADAFRAPFALGDAARLAALCEQAGIGGAEIEARSGTLRFASIDALVSSERECVWTLGGLLDAAQFERLLAASREALAPFAQADGAIAFDMPALLITATKR